MNTSVNSETWISVGNSTPTTASEAPCIASAAVSPIAAMTNRTACIGVVVATISAQSRNALHITKPNHDAFSISAATMAIAASAERNAALGQEILAVMQPGNLSRVVRRPEHHVGEQQQLERHEVGEPQCREHEAQMRSVGDAHRHFPQPDDRSIRADSGTVAYRRQLVIGARGRLGAGAATSGSRFDKSPATEFADVIRRASLRNGAVRRHEVLAS